jgi:signal peptide peptidase SppA
MKYPHLMARLFNVPLLIDPAKASTIFRGIASRIGIEALGEDLPGAAAEHQAKREMVLPQGTRRSQGGSIVMPGGIAVVVADGSLCHAAAGSYPPSGMTSYGEIRAQVERAAADQEVRAILLDVDSPGGEASDSAFALSARIRELRAVKPIWSICDEVACSGGYLIASAAEKVFAPALSYTGSIGVYMALLDATKADKMEGLDWTFVHAGSHKLDGNPSISLDKEFVARMQADVDATYARFLGEVGASRPKLGVKGAKTTEARFYRGTEALEVGLIDGIADFETVHKQMQSRLQSSVGLPMQTQVRQEASAEAAAGDVSPQAAAAAPNQETIMENNENKSAQSAAPAPQAGNVVDINAARKEGSDAARKEVAEIVELCTLAGKSGLAAGFIAAGKSVADVRKDLLAEKAKSDMEINTQHGPQPGAHAAGGKVLVGECERLAKLSAKKSA